MAPGPRRLTATDYAWRHVGRLGTGLGLTLLGLCRIIDNEALRPVSPMQVARLVGKASSTTARDLHTLADRGLIVRSTMRAGAGVVYTVPVLEAMTRPGADI